MKFSGKMYFEIMLKVTKYQGFTLSLQDIFFEKPQGGININIKYLKTGITVPSDSLYT